MKSYGHTWSPLHELTPETPLRHGHAISIDMAYSATLANIRGKVSDSDHKRILDLFSKVGLSMDHHQFDEDLLEKATTAILKTRDGKLRAAVPSPLGSCVFLNDVSHEDMVHALRKHKEIMKKYPRNGEGLEAFVDASDTGYTMNKKSPQQANGTKGAHTNGVNGSVMNDDASKLNGNGLANKDAKAHASGPEGVDGIQDGVRKGGEHHTNGD